MPKQNLSLLEVLPEPISLIESMRAVGYTLEAAIADIIDNSLSASATEVVVEYDASDSAYVAILDNGLGMTPSELTEAMRHGKNPGDARDALDLGRFGLGLKTASLSQCRKLTVVSKKDGNTSARCWDLDVVQSEDRWVVVVPSEIDLQSLAMYEQLCVQQTGTLVVWENLDRLIAGAQDPIAEMTAKFSGLENHLALVFHRFTEKEPGQKSVEITLNGRRLKSLDPFLRQNHFRQALEGQVIRHEKGDVTVTPHVLPPVSHLTVDEIDLAGGIDGLRHSQGFYIYRARRLVIWGTWFRLVPKDEFYKLARIQVDIPNSFDELWGLDIKKSIAYPPDVIRMRLRQLIPYFADKSKHTVTYRGRRISAKEHSPLWIRREGGKNNIRYEVNLEHQLLRALSDELTGKQRKRLTSYFALLEQCLPMEAIYADMCVDNRGGVIADYETTLEFAEALMSIPGVTIDEALAMEPLDRLTMHHKRIREEFSK